MEITEDIFYKKIKEYNAGSDYTPLKIVFDIGSPVYLNSPYLHLDSVLAYLCLRDALDDYFYILPTEKIIDISQLDIPLKKTEDIYHSSIGFYSNIYQLKTDKVYKRFTDKETYHLSNKHKKGKILINRGHFKDFIIQMPTIITDKIIFYCNGDKKELERLLSHLRNIGKKTSIGGGKINNIKITETLTDYSFFKDETVMRPIPCNMKLPLVEGMVFQKATYKPPYWNKHNATMCYMPPNQIKETIHAENI